MSQENRKEVWLAFFFQEINSRYRDNALGIFWVFIQPLLFLVLYQFVFVEIFKIRVSSSGFEGFLPFFAIAYWPWAAFSESVIRSLGSLADSKNILLKVKVEPWLITSSKASVVFFIHILSYGFVILVLDILYIDISFIGYVIVVLMIVWLYLICFLLWTSLSLITVFISDLEEIAQPFFTLLFFMSPILYSLEQLPNQMQPLLSSLPFAVFVDMVRMTASGVIKIEFLTVVNILIWPIVLFLIAYFSNKRLASSIGDYL